MVRRNTILFSLFFLIAIFFGAYVYTAPSFFNLNIGNQIKNAQTAVQEKILEISKDTSFTNPLIGSREYIASSLTVDGVWVWTNTRRENNSEYPALKKNIELSKIAELRAEDMFSKQYFEHESPDGENASSVAKDVGYEFIAIGENIALGNFKDDETLVEAWMNSPGHRANILSKKFTEIGIAVKKGLYDGDQIWIAVQIFGRPLSDCREASPYTKNKIENNQKEIDRLKDEASVLQTSFQNYSGAEYNQKVTEYNVLVKKINASVTETKSLVSEYNNQIRLFNTCIEK